jgi:putative MATE family efflux protein
MTFGEELRAVLRGAHRDYTTGPLSRAIVLLAVPMVLELVMESLFALVDIFWVARLGPNAAAAVGVTESVESLVYGVLMGLGIGATAVVARRVGEKDPEQAAIAAVQAIALGLVVAVAITIPGVIFAPHFLGWMGADAQVVATGAGFARTMMAATPVLMLLFVLNAIFRGAGDAVIAMKVLWFANLINMVLDPCLIFGWGPFPALGVTGAAVATTTGRTCGVLLQIYYLFHEQSRVRIARRHLRLDTGVLRSVARLALTGTVQFLIPTASWTALVRIISLSGGAALAGYTIAIRIVIFSLLPSWGLSNSAATLVGQNLGAGQPERAEKSVWITGFYNACFLVLVGALYFLVPEWLIGFFTRDAEVSRYAVACLRTLAVGYVFYAYGMVMAQAFNGAGDTTTPTLINLGCYWVLQLPLAWWFAVPAGHGAEGALWAVPVAETVLALVAAALFRRGRWKLKTV